MIPTNRRPRSSISISLAILLLAGCASTISEFYPDSYFFEDRVYQNKPLRFSLTFRSAWSLITDPNEMAGPTRDFAQELREMGLELLFVGTTAEGTQGTRGIAANLNIPARDYAERIRTANAETISEDYGFTDMLADGKPMVRWDYLSHGFRFAEFYFTLDTYNVRIAFWAKPDTFERFLPVYIDIMSSLSFIDRI